MSARVPKLRRWIIVTAVAVCILFAIQAKTVLDVAAVQNAVQRDWEIGFGPPPQPVKPLLLPEWLDAEAWKYFFRRYPEAVDPGAPAKQRNRKEIAYARFQSFFRGPIRRIDVYDFEAFHGDLAAALGRFPLLRQLRVFDSGDLVTERDWTFFCTRVRTVLPELEEIELGGAWLTDRAIAPLSGHPKLRSVSIGYGRLTPASAATLAALPRLARVQIDHLSPDGELWLSPANQAAAQAALPAVRIEFR